ncbi:MAG: hypothetical protein WC497_04040 [Patescibacteria group bacterium]
MNGNKAAEKTAKPDRIEKPSEVVQPQTKNGNGLIELEQPMNLQLLKRHKKFWRLGSKDYHTEYFDINRDGNLIVKEGNYQYHIKDIVQKFGTSLQILFPFIIKDRLENVIDLFNLLIKYYRYRGKFFYHFPMKVNQNKEVLLSMVSEGANLETASYNELWLVKKLWEQNSFLPSIRVICNGPKTEDYLKLIEELQSKNLNIIPVVEDMSELNFFSKYKGDIGIRVDLDVSVSSHWDKKIDRYGLLADELIKLGKIRNLKMLHYHIGSQIELQEDMIAPVKKCMKLFIEMKKKNPSLDTLDIGGGMPIPYDLKKRFGFEGVARRIIRLLQSMADKAEVPHPNIVCEWGRYVVAPAQITIFRVMGEKDIPRGNARKWQIVDGSFMNDLPDTWTLHQKWHVVPVNHLNFSKRHLVRAWLAGSSCDSDDKYIAHGNYVLLPDLEYLDEGDTQYIAFLCTGAYQDSLSCNHCLLSSPAKIVARNGEVKINIRRQTPEDISKLFGW